MTITPNTPILWSFRRCPYAMRARLAIKSSQTEVELREIVLRDKPAPFLAASAKGTVPVMVMEDGTVLDESRDIMFWALHRHDPEGWLDVAARDPDGLKTFLDELDGPFKTHLDRYKYASRYKDTQDDDKTADIALHHRHEGMAFLNTIDNALADMPFLSGEKIGVKDIAALPFIRQFRIADIAWFDDQDLPNLHPWLQDFINSPRFAAVMEKYKPWNTSPDEPGAVF